MIIKYNADFSRSAIEDNLKRIINQVYKLLPMREQGADWQKPLETLIVELSGMSRLLQEQQGILFSLLCKMEGLFTLTSEEDFLVYRRTIFECLGQLNLITKDVHQKL